jgi:HEAT repeat protein
MLDGLDEVPWGTLRHNYGAADDIAGLLRGCTSQDRAEALRAADQLDNHLYHQGGWICPAASAALPFLAELAASPRVTVREAVTGTITSLASVAAEVAPRWVDQAWPGAMEAALPALLRLLDDPDPRVRQAAGRLAGVRGLGPDLVLPALRARLREEPDEAVRYDLTMSLGGAAARSPQAAEVSGELAVIAGSADDNQERLAAVHGLARLGEPVYEYVDLMVRAASGEYWDVVGAGELLAASPLDTIAYAVGLSRKGTAEQRAAAMASIGLLLQQWRAVPDSVLPHLGGQLQAPEPDVRFRAAFLLACLGRAAAPYADQVAALLADDARTSSRVDERVSDAAVWALLRLGDPRGAAGLRDRLAGDRLGFTDHEAHYPGSGGFWWGLPSIGQAVRLAGPSADLLDLVLRLLRRSREAGPPSLTNVLCKVLADHGPVPAAVPDLIRVLEDSVPGRFPGPAAASALGKIGEGAHSAAPELRRHARAGCWASAWAGWRVSGDPGAALAWLLAEFGKPSPAGVRQLAEFGSLAAAAEPRLRAILASERETVTGAAYTLWRITGDSDTAVRALSWAVPYLLDGTCTPSMTRAMEHLAEIGQGVPEVTAAARFVLASPLRLTSSGGWRAFTDDERIQAAATAYLARTGQSA